MRRLLPSALLLSLLLVGSVPAKAQLIDPANDFLATYTGPLNGDMDILQAQVTYTGSHFLIQATMGGNIGTTPGAFYVLGFDRGQGTQRFVGGTPSIGAGVSFDSVILLRPDTTAQVNRLVGGGSTSFGSGTVTINGALLSALIPTSTLPSLGLAPGQYTWNLWPRTSTVTGNAAISDFAPNASMAPSAAAPEPLSLALLSLGGVVLLRRRRR